MKESENLSFVVDEFREQFLSHPMDFQIKRPSLLSELWAYLKYVILRFE